MDTLEEPECPPYKNRIFVSSSKDFEGYPSKAIVPVQFVALLTSIHLTETKCLLGFSNFERRGDQSQEDQYLIKLKFKDRGSERLARITISLLCQYFDIELPDLDSDSGASPTVILRDIHLERLCFSSCKALYVSKHGNYTLFLEDIKPLDLVSVISTISTKSTNSSKHSSSELISECDLNNSLVDIFNNLIEMNRDEKNRFKFVKLIHYDIELKSSFKTNKRYYRRNQKPQQLILSLCQID